MTLQRKVAWICFTTAMWATFVTPAQATTETKNMIWEGYLFQDKDGQVYIGHAMIASDSMAGPAEIFDQEFGERLKPFLSQAHGGDFFWNYEWYGGGVFHLRAADVRHVPRVLVEVRGDVVQEQEDPSSGFYHPFGSPEPMLMTHGQLRAVEFLGEKWLVTWRNLMQLGINWWNESEREGATHEDPTKIKYLAPKVLALLTEMQRESQITPAQREMVKRVDPNAKVVTHFQGEWENRVHRWLVRMNNRYQFHLPDLDALGTLPPASATLQKWFLSAASRADFLKQVRSHWLGDLDDLVLWFWHQEPNHGYLASVRLGELSEWWTDEFFLKEQKSTRADRASYPAR